MKRIITYVLSIVLIFFTGSCNDDFMDRKPLDRISEADVWEDPVLMQAFVNQIYAELVHGHSYDFKLMCLCDEAVRRGWTTYFNVNEGLLSPTLILPLEYWPKYYMTISGCNSIIDNVQDKEYNEQVQPQVDRVLGEAKFLRAYVYSKLVALHGGVILVKKSFRLDDDLLLPRNSYEECINFIITELDEAAALLDESYTGEHLGRATKGAALALKSRVLLYDASLLNNPSNDRGKWEKAAQAAKDVIDMNIYSLYPNYKELFTMSFNQEIIWARIFNNTVRAEHNLEQAYYPNGSGGYGQVHPLHNATEFFEMKASGLLPKDDPAYDPQNPYVGRDPRFYDCILYDGATWQNREIETFLPGGLDSSDGPDGWNTSQTGYYPRKFIDESVIRPTGGTEDGSSPWIYLRYGEILLNYAEAMFYLGDEDECRKYLNLIRDRQSVQMPHITDTGAKLEERIRNERYVELFFEEHRFFDVRRWRIAMQTDNEPSYRMNVNKNPVTGIKTYEVIKLQDRKFYDQNYLVPIPQGERDKNPKLGQNPGYFPQ